MNEAVQDVSAAATRHLQPIRQKWGDALSAGFVVVPTVLLKHQGRLELGSDEVVVLINFFLVWREASDTPFPRTSTIARRMGASPRTVQRHIAKLEEKGFVRRVPSQLKADGSRTFTQYDMSGTLAKLRELGEEAKLLAPRGVAASAAVGV